MTTNKDTTEAVLDELILKKIYVIRGKKVMLDRDLAILYRVTTGNLNKAVKRNQKRFPEDFMFQLTIKELNFLIFQFGISSWGGTRKPPFAFTEHGVAMLSGVLNSDIAIEVNIRIIKIFTRLREMLVTQKELLVKIEQLEMQVLQNNKDIKTVFDTLRQLFNESEPERPEIGFKISS
jgi:ORF6N domain